MNMIVVKMIICGLVAAGLIPALTKSWADIIGIKWGMAVSFVTAFLLLYLITEFMPLIRR